MTTTFEADDVVLADIQSNGNGIDVTLYVRSGDSMVLNGQALLQAIQVSIIMSLLTPRNS